MKKMLLLSVAMVGAVAFLFGSPLVSTSATAGDTLLPVRSITVTGLAQKKVVPDEAHLSVQLQAKNMKLATAKTEHDSKLRKLLKIVNDAGIDEKKIATQNMNVQPQYDWVEDATTHQSKQRFLGYLVQSSLDITVEDTSKLADLQDAVLNSGLENEKSDNWGNFTSMYYSVSHPEQRREELLVDAIANAHGKALRMAEAADAELAGVLQVTEGGASIQPMPMRMMAAPAMAMKMERDIASIAPPAGEEELQSTVTVTYELK